MSVRLRSLVAVGAILVVGCATQLAATRRGPPPQGVDPGADPFADRRDVESEPVDHVRVDQPVCGAELFVGPKACFVRGTREAVVQGRPVGDGGMIAPPPEVDFEYWLDCGAVDRPCEGGRSFTCLCRESASL